ncbi:MAG TPA: transposase [Candidatus Competibacteraceae bacterium]|nr:transposase [Candidatus Competibacteraceae bacterium]
MTIIGVFAPLFTAPVWRHVLVLLSGAILAPGKRTVTAVLRGMGFGHERRVHKYHRVLSHARWSVLAASRLLLGELLAALVPVAPVVMGLDDPIERRRGEKITAQGIYRDPGRSSKGHFVKARGLRWLSLMLLAPVPWAQRVGALPVLTVLCPSERYYHARGRTHRPLTERARQLLQVVHRWLPHREKVVVADSSFAALEVLAALPQQLHVVTRLRLDAALYAAAPARQAGQQGRPRKKGKRRPTLEPVAADPATRWTPLTLPRWYSQGERTVEMVTGTAVWYHSGKPPVPIRWVLVRDLQGSFEPQAFLCTNLQATAPAILMWFVQRWQVEVTFEEARAHLGVETQRQWSDQAIARTMPVLMGLFSRVTLIAHQRPPSQEVPVRTSPWYAKPRPTFSDALALVRSRLWQHRCFSRSVETTKVVKVPAILLEQLTEALCYAA